MKTILIFSLLGLSINLTFSQNNNSQDSLVWENLKLPQYFAVNIEFEL